MDLIKKSTTTAGSNIVTTVLLTAGTAGQNVTPTMISTSVGWS